MRKTIDFVPIYKGELNMTPDRFNAIKDAKISARRKFQRIISTVEGILILMSSSYLVLAMLGIWR